MTDPPPTRPLTLRLALIGLLLLGVILRWAQFPKPGQPPQIDELGYMSGGLTLLEGITPGYKFAPAGPTTWLGWAYAGTEATKNLIMPGPEERAVPIQVRPFVAVNHALFDLYRDFSGLQHFIVIFNIVLSVIAISPITSPGPR